MITSHYYNDHDPYCCQWLRNLIDAGEIPPGDVNERSITDVRAEDLDGYTQAHFFCGIGGWPLALRLAGWPPATPVWTGSCPCQPFSAAGKGLCEKDPRHLWPEFLRLIRECRPEVIFGEQVASAEVVGTQLEAAFAIAVQSGDYARANKLAKRLVASRGFHYWTRWVDRVRADLEAADYALRYAILGAHSVGAPHIRQRLFWVADSNSTRHREPERQGERGEAGRTRAPEINPAGDGDAHWLADTERNGGRINEQERGPEGRTADRGTGAGTDRLGDANGSQSPLAEVQSARQERQAATGAGWHDYAIVHCRDGKSRRIPDAQSGILPLAHGIPRDLGRRFPQLARMVASARANRVGRLRAYGNAIVPEVAAVFIRAYMEARSKS